MPPRSAPPVSLRSWTTPGISAVRRYWRPFLLLQSCALALVITYYATPADGIVHNACRYVSNLKQTYGILFTALTAAFAGAILPEFTKLIALGERRFDRSRLFNIAFALAAFAVNGFYTDYQYRLLAFLFGNDASFLTAAKKVLTDQFICTTIVSIPYWTLIYGWKNNAFRLAPTLGEISPRWYLTKVMPLLIPAWAFWIPMTTLIYILPGDLQYCMFLIVLAAWSLIMVFVANRPAIDTEKPDVSANHITSPEGSL